MFIRILVLMLSIITTLDSIAGTRDPYIPDQKYIQYGQKFIFVGKLCGKYENDNQFCASAVAIDNHHILTAAHVVDNSKSCFVYFNEKEFCLSKVIIHEDFEESPFGTADIAIGYCSESFGLSKYPELYDTNDEIGKECSISGYGLTGTFKTGIKHSDNHRRAGLNHIDSISVNMLICNASRNIDSNKTSLEFIIGSGDSGGGLFISNKLAGINSCVMSSNRAPNSVYDDESGHTRVSHFIKWISDNKTTNNE